MSMEILNDAVVVFAPPRRGRPTASAAPDQLSCKRHWNDDGALVLQFRGQLDINTVLTFRDLTFTALGERPTQLFIDLSSLRSIESTGISTLVTLSRVARLVKVPVVYVSSEELAATCEMTGLDTLLGGPLLTGDAIAERILSAS